MNEMLVHNYFYILVTGFSITECVFGFWNIEVSSQFEFLLMILEIMKLC